MFERSIRRDSKQIQYLNTRPRAVRLDDQFVDLADGILYVRWPLTLVRRGSRLTANHELETEEVAHHVTHGPARARGLRVVRFRFTRTQRPFYRRPCLFKCVDNPFVGHR